MKMQPQPLVSVVTPVYNEEKYLSECIESVLAQSYDNWEYTIVNNCSTDRSLEIALQYAAKDSRIRVHNNDRFLEMLPNLNLAIRQISPNSKYCKVVLGDDWIFPRCLEQMVASAERYPSVGVVSAYEQRGQEIRITGLPSERTLVSGREACSLFLQRKLFLFGSQTSVLYRANLVRNLRPLYDESNLYADFEACFALLMMSDLGFVHEILTFSRPRPTSVGSIAADIGAPHGSMLDILLVYGNECLSPGEYREAVNLELADYYRFLGRRLLTDYDPEFWSYHQEVFAKRGLELKRARVATTAVKELCKAVLDLRSTVESIRRFLRLRKIRTGQTRSVVLKGGARFSSRQRRVGAVCETRDIEVRHSGAQ